MAWIKLILLIGLLATAPEPARNEPLQDEPEIFVPTERLPADQAVVFPVDI